MEKADEAALSKLQASFSKLRPIETEEISLIDKFILSH